MFEDVHREHGPVAETEIEELRDARRVEVRNPRAVHLMVQNTVNQLRANLLNLKPVLSWRTAITQLKEVPSGTGLSYGHSYVTPRQSLIATVPVGYGDGLARPLSNRIEMLAGGRRCRQVGTICMDQCLVDVSPLKGRVEEGDEVVILGEQGDQFIGAEEQADVLGTINYEIVTRISGRVPRIPEK